MRASCHNEFLEEKETGVIQAHHRRLNSYTAEQKPVVALCSRRGSAEDVADAHGATRTSLYKLKHDLLSEIETLKEQARRPKIEKDILEAAAERISGSANKRQRE